MKKGFGQVDAFASEGSPVVGSYDEHDAKLVDICRDISAAAPDGQTTERSGGETRSAALTTNEMETPASGPDRLDTPQEAPTPSGPAPGLRPWVELTRNAEREEICRIMLQMNARFCGPTAVAAFIQDTYGVVVRRQDVEYYDPTKQRGKNLLATNESIWMRVRSMRSRPAIRPWAAPPTAWSASLVSLIRLWRKRNCASR